VFTQAGACSGARDQSVLSNGGTGVLAIACSACFIAINSKVSGSRPGWWVRKSLKETASRKNTSFRQAIHASDKLAV
jgi:hypothetical protein